MLVKDHLSPSDFGVVVIREGLVQEIVEKPEFAPSHTVSTGIYSLQQDALDFLESTEMPDAIGAMLKDGIPSRPCVPTTGRMPSIPGYPADERTAPEDARAAARRHDLP